MRRSRGWGPLGAALLIVVLAGCAPEPGPTAPPAAEPTPTPTYVQPAVPVADIPLGCADMLSVGFVQDHYLGDTLTAAVDEGSTPRGLLWRLYAQGGGLRCVWAGQDRTDGGYDIGLELQILGGGADAYQAWVDSAGNPSLAWVIDEYGDRSKTFCYSAEPGEEYVTNAFMQCYGGVLVGDYWLDFVMSDSDQPLTDAEAMAWGAEQLAPVIAKIQSAGEARPGWVAPEGSYDGADLCTDDGATAAAGGPTTVSARSWLDEVWQNFVGARRADALVSCTWTSTVASVGTVSVDIQQGGAWALDGMHANLAEVPGILGGAARPIDVAGADGAFVADGETAWGALVIGGSIVEVRSQISYQGDDVIPLLEGIAARVGSLS